MRLRNPERFYSRDEYDNYVLNKQGNKQLDATARVTIFDAYHFFQQSCAKAVNVLTTMGLAKDEDFAFVEEMKAKRGRSAEGPIETIKRYTEFELRYLARIMTVLRATLDAIKLDCAPNMKPIHIKDRYGPGHVARAFSNALDIIKKHCGEYIHSQDHGLLRIAAHHAFAAGRIEMPKTGHAPDAALHSYDIASAHPHVISQPPSLTGEIGQRLRADIHTLHSASWNND